MLRWILVLITLTGCLGPASSPTTSRQAPLSAEPSLIDRLNSPEGRAELDAATRGAPERFNRVTLVHLGKNSAPLRRKLIREAKSHLFMSIPYWYGDEHGTAMLEELKANRHANPMLDARLMADWLSPAMSGDIFKRGIFRELKRATGGQVELWNRPWSARPWSFNIVSRRLHDKMVIVDGEKLLLGGMNMGDTYLKGGLTREGWHDSDLLIEGPTAQDAQEIFLKNWYLSKFFAGSGSFPGSRQEQSRVLQEIYYGGKDIVEYKAFNPGAPGADRRGNVAYRLTLPLESFRKSSFYFPVLSAPDADASSTRLIYDHPLVDRDLVTGKTFSKTRQTLEVLFRHARKGVRIFLPYLTISRAFRESLTELATRVPVEIITNSMQSHDLTTSAYYGAFSNYGALIAAGVKIYEWTGHPPLEMLEKSESCEIPIGEWPGQTLHTKMVIIDDEAVLIGSHNMNVRSESYNTEVMALVLDPRLAREAHAVFNHDLDESESRQIQCGDRTLERPRRVSLVTHDFYDQFRKRHHKKITDASRRQQLM